MTKVRNRKRDVEETKIFYKRKFRWFNRCVYCGENAEQLDHVFPVSVASTINLNFVSARKELKQGLNLVPSCEDCNRIATNKIFVSILEKRKYIQKKIREKNKNILKKVVWDEEDLEDVGYNILSTILEGQRKKEKIEFRITWPDSKSSVELNFIKLLQRKMKR